MPPSASQRASVPASPRHADREQPRVTAPAFASSGPAPAWLLFGLLAIAIGFVMYVAQSLLVPIVAAVYVSILFAPIARGLRRLGAPPPLAAAIVMVAASVLLTASVAFLGTSLGEWINRAPHTIETLQGKLESVKEPVATVQEATANLEEIASMDDTEWVQQVEVRPPSISGTILSQSMAVLAGLGICLALTFLLLCSGDQIVANTIRSASTFAQRRRLLRAVRCLEQDMTRYLTLRTAVNVGLGVAAYIVFALLELPNPLVWAATVAILNYVPYVGAVVVTILVAVVSIIEFDTLSRAALPPLAVMGLNLVEGFIVTPLVLGRCLRLHPVMIFLATVAGGWIWGIAGAFLAVPILASVVIALRHFPHLQPIAQFLGGDRPIGTPPPTPRRVTQHEPAFTSRSRHPQPAGRPSSRTPSMETAS
ncbi:MAG: AI-2E family transporter [Phycisphaerales bacterium]|nr:AI-2E family transporter [Phycisphaerales bacterium]NNM27171.1 AI-2E family transporter [Phycisphaerales bacterium]